MLWAFWHLLDLLFYFWGGCLFLLLLLSWYICKFPVSLKLLYNHPSYVWELFRWLNKYNKMPMGEQISSRFYIPCVFSKGILFTCSGLTNKFFFSWEILSICTYTLPRTLGDMTGDDTFKQTFKKHHSPGLKCSLFDFFELQLSQFGIKSKYLSDIHMCHPFIHFHSLNKSLLCIYYVSSIQLG